MYNFLVKTRPRSYNSWRRNSSKGMRYTQKIRHALHHYCPDFHRMEVPLYGIVYYFYKQASGLDADNLSKPVWDSLTNILYKDDQQIKWRLAAAVNLQMEDLAVFTMNGLREPLFNDFLDALENEEDFLYIECGSMHNDLLRFDWHLW